MPKNGQYWPKHEAGVEGTKTNVVCDGKSSSVFNAMYQTGWIIQKLYLKFTACII